MGDEQATREYSNGEVVVVWKSSLCTHSANCIRGLPLVFDTKRRPWIDPLAASTAEIVAQVARCPSAALSIRPAGPADPPANAVAEVPPPTAVEPTVTIEISAAGPLLVRGRVKVQLADGSAVERGETTAFCRCGASAKKPYCDGSHRRIEFVG